MSHKIDNPSDVLFRGADARDLRDNNLWWQGLEFLLRDIPDPEEFPCSKDKTFEKELFLKTCLYKNMETGFLTAAELDNAEQLLTKRVQSTTFTKEKTALQDVTGVSVSRTLKSPDPFLDSNSILRVGVV
ncbi:hypothetical protein AVEN_188664-1 [Araneus ventricosus]|uniref:Uncharacterized protein n=1 Tax=Araneus ventricosus TaxID=182803 RepID=A0A4Y2KRB1_ARAVE|nr:hypothetical protein AVEN_188664-1 [Araneus ventricosus]